MRALCITCFNWFGELRGSANPSRQREGRLNDMPVPIEPIEGNVVPEGDDGERKRVLVCSARYLPGYKSGGPIRSVANMISHLSPYFDFYVLTNDRDATDTA